MWPLLTHGWKMIRKVLALPFGSWLTFARPLCKSTSCVIWWQSYTNQRCVNGRTASTTLSYHWHNVGSQSLTRRYNAGSLINLFIELSVCSEHNQRVFAKGENKWTPTCGSAVNTQWPPLLQCQKAATAHLKSEQLMLFGFAEQRICHYWLQNTHEEPPASMPYLIMDIMVYVLLVA